LWQRSEARCCEPEGWKMMTIEPTTRSRPPSHCRDAHALSRRTGIGQAAGAITDHPFFANIDDLEVELVTGAADSLHFETSETLFRRGDPGDSVLLMLSGRAAVQSHRSSGEPIVMNIVEQGELLGEMAVLEGAPRSATVTALEPCEVLAIPNSDFLALLVNHPGLAIRMLGSMSDRLRRLTERVVELT
jgi:CRP/FNR family cyclic AMP-dependent transcriptional regulator